MTEFIRFPKIARYSRDVIVTEKIDGTNASVFIGDDGEFLTGSRTRWVTPEDDNLGFSKWAHEHKDELLALGPGRHFGEFWGFKIQRTYGLKEGDRRFSLFNVTRWCLHGQEPQQIPTGDPRQVKMQSVLPPCVGLVPVVWRGNFDDLDLSEILDHLKSVGSYAMPGFERPEGVVVYHVASNTCFKKTMDDDGQPKSKKVKE